MLIDHMRACPSVAVCQVPLNCSTLLFYSTGWKEPTLRSKSFGVRCRRRPWRTTNPLQIDRVQRFDKKKLRTFTERCLKI